MKSNKLPAGVQEEPFYTVLTLFQPWASLVVMGFKENETRGWNTKYRGRLLIHASARIPKEARTICAASPFSKYISDIDSLPVGAILGEVDLVKVYPTDVMDRMLQVLPDRVRAIEEWQFGDYSMGRFAWKLGKPVQWATPMLAKGSMSLWRIKQVLVDGHLGHRQKVVQIPFT